jgi:hypothetical protein
LPILQKTGLANIEEGKTNLLFCQLSALATAGENSQHRMKMSSALIQYPNISLSQYPFTHTTQRPTVEDA